MEHPSHPHELPSFPHFNRLPPEVRILIWKATLDNEEAGVCIPRVREVHDDSSASSDSGSGSDSDSDSEESDSENAELDGTLQPLTVNCKLPVIFHACRESRNTARLTTPHKENSIGACYNAHRDFDPSKDIFFVTSSFEHLFPLWKWEGTKDIKHIGLEYPNSLMKLWYLMVAFWFFIVFHDIPKASIIHTPHIDAYFAQEDSRFEVRLIHAGNWARLRGFHMNVDLALLVRSEPEGDEI
ncbi:hypothetical protein F4804DRAFT_316738 [Jackrogersella minutella]|nr:hypothetical protein F4804DRAFT_316738 [Jackrogersella minutella]